MPSLRSKVSEAKNRAGNLATKIAAGDTVMRNAKAAGIEDLTTAEFKAARKVLQPRMRQDRKKTAARGEAIQKIQTKKAAAKRAAAAIGNSPAAKKTAKPAVKKKAK
jgi:hypothetical protein